MFSVFAGSIKLASTCKNSSQCDKSSSRALSRAMNRSDIVAVCSLLPIYMQCLENALKTCTTDPRDQRLDRESIRSKLNGLKLKHKSMCPGMFSEDNVACRTQSHFLGLAVTSFISIFLTSCAIHLCQVFLD
nr:hypothetical protein BgiMline_007829 [Biomphalaria glabrata]